MRLSWRVPGHWTPHAPPIAMGIVANSPTWQNIAHDKKQQGAAHGGFPVVRFTWTEHDDTL
jgi:hypothetical protein